MSARCHPLGVVGLVCAAALAGCGDADPGSGGAIGVVATTTQVADIAREVGGDRVDVRGILEPEADPHGYEPRPSDVAELADAAVVLRSGGEVDGWLEELVDNSGTDAELLNLIDRVRTLEGGENDEVDPHWWQDPRNAVLATESIRTALTEADPRGRSAYRRNARRYTERLQDLDADIEACMADVPAAKRKLVTTHDSLRYFAERYGLEVIGSVLASLSTQAQPSAKDIDALVDQIERENVEAVFPEEAVSERLERAVSRESGAEVGEPLFTDSLGSEGSPAATYLGSLRENARRLALGLSGGELRCP